MIKSSLKSKEPKIKIVNPINWTKSKSSCPFIPLGYARKKHQTITVLVVSTVVHDVADANLVTHIEKQMHNPIEHISTI